MPTNARTTGQTAPKEQRTPAFDRTKQNIGLVAFVGHDDQCPGMRTTAQQRRRTPIREVTGRIDGQPTRAGASLELRGQVSPSATETKSLVDSFSRTPL